MTEMPEEHSYNSIREEIICSHGVGHPAPWCEKEVHGCCGCCTGNPVFDQAVEAARDSDSLTEGDSPE